MLRLRHLRLPPGSSSTLQSDPRSSANPLRASFVLRYGVALIVHLFIVGASGGPTWAQCASGPFGVPGLQLPADQIGQWGPVEQWPVQGTHVTVLSSGYVLFWRGEGNVPTTTYLWDPLTGTIVSEQAPATDLFCAGHATLADGRVIAVGGTFNDEVAGVSDTNIFDPISETWTQVAEMEFARWYPTSTTLPDGRVLSVSGLIETTNADVPEVYDVETDTWTQLTAAELSLPLYPPNFVLPSGKILVATTTTRTLDVDNQIWEVIATTNFDSGIGGSVAMYEPGRALKIGGGDPAVARAEVIDMTEVSPAWREVAAMAYARRRADLVLLPDGKALAVAGAVAEQFTPQCAVHAAEMWAPDSETWTTMASMARPRIYHSTAVLLPDGRVLSAGGETDHDSPGERTAEIYSPPYLFKGPRPTTDTAPSSVTYAETFQVATLDAGSIASVAFMRPGSVTHNFDQNQRYLSLDFVQNVNSLDVSAPQDPNLAPPGEYMLFLLNGNGVPSVARFVSLGCGAACRSEEVPSPAHSRWGLALLTALLLACAVGSLRAQRGRMA